MQLKIHSITCKLFLPKNVKLELNQDLGLTFSLQSSWRTNRQIQILNQFVGQLTQFLPEVKHQKKKGRVQGGDLFEIKRDLKDIPNAMIRSQLDPDSNKSIVNGSGGYH